MQHIFTLSCQNLKSTVNLEKQKTGLEAVKKAGCSCIGPEFSSEHPNGCF